MASVDVDELLQSQTEPNPTLSPAPTHASCDLEELLAYRNSRMQQNLEQAKADKRCDALGATKR